MLEIKCRENSFVFILICCFPSKKLKAFKSDHKNVLDILKKVRYI